MAEWKTVCYLLGDICGDVRTLKTLLIFFFSFFFGVLWWRATGFDGLAASFVNTIDYSRISTKYKRVIIWSPWRGGCLGALLDKVPGELWAEWTALLYPTACLICSGILWISELKYITQWFLKLAWKWVLFITSFNSGILSNTVRRANHEIVSL